MTGAALRRVGGGWMALFTVVWIALWMVQLTPVQLLLPLHLNTPGDAGRWIEGVVWSGLILSVGGVAGIIVGPLAGRLSDLTRSRFGRRRPWVAGGALLTALALILTGLATIPLTIGAAWVGVWIGVATMAAALTAMIADQLDAQRGSASAAVSSAQAVGVVVGVAVVVLLGLGVVESYIVLAVTIAVVGVGCAIVLPDPPVTAPLRASDRARRGIHGALRTAGFAWLLGSRLLVNIGNALVTALLLFFLMYGIGSATAEDDLLIIIVIYTVFVVAASVIAGIVSDRTGARRGLTIVSAVVQAASVLVILVAPSFTGTAIAAALMGVGYGANMAVGLALATDLLPDGADNGRDLGLVNVAANLGQLIGPLLGAGLVALVGGFWLLIVASAVLSAAGAVMTLPVRPARSSPAPRPAAR